MTEKKKDLIELLISRQAEMDLTNTSFAKKLGVSRTLWVLTKKGKRRINATLLSAVTRTFPDLDEHILIFLRSKKRDSN